MFMIKIDTSKNKISVFAVKRVTFRRVFGVLLVSHLNVCDQKKLPVHASQIV